MFAVDLGEHREPVGLAQHRSRRLPGGHTLAHVRYPCRSMLLSSFDPAPEDCVRSCELPKPLFCAERHRYLCAFVNHLIFPAEVMEPSRMVECPSETIGMRHLLGEGQRLVAPFQRFV